MKILFRRKFKKIKNLVAVVAFGLLGCGGGEKDENKSFYNECMNIEMKMKTNGMSVSECTREEQNLLMESSLVCIYQAGIDPTNPLYSTDECYHYMETFDCLFTGCDGSVKLAGTWDLCFYGCVPRQAPWIKE